MAVCVGMQNTFLRKAFEIKLDTTMRCRTVVHENHGY